MPLNGAESAHLLYNARLFKACVYLGGSDV